MVRDSFRSFSSEITLVEQNDKPMDCGTFIGWTRLWILEAPGFTDVPGAWSSLSVEYRSLLQQIVNLTAEVRMLCDAEGGEIDGDDIMAFMAWAYPRSEQMVTESLAIQTP